MIDQLNFRNRLNHAVNRQPVPVTLRLPCYTYYDIQPEKDR